MDKSDDELIREAREMCHRLAGALHCLRRTVATSDSHYLAHAVIAPLDKGIGPGVAHVTVDHVVAGAMDAFTVKALEWMR